MGTTGRGGTSARYTKCLGHLYWVGSIPRAIVRRRRTWLDPGGPPVWVRFRGHKTLGDFKVIRALVGQLAVLVVSTANAVIAILAEDLRIVQASTAQMGVLVVGLCRKHKVLSQSNSHEDTLQWTANTQYKPSILKYTVAMINNIISPKFHFLILLLLSPPTVDCSDDRLTFSIGLIKLLNFQFNDQWKCALVWRKCSHRVRCLHLKSAHVSAPLPRGIASRGWWRCFRTFARVHLPPSGGAVYFIHCVLCINHGLRLQSKGQEWMIINDSHK